MSVQLSVRLSHAGIVSKRLNISSNIFTIRQPYHSSFSLPNIMAIFPPGPSSNAGENRDFWPTSGLISEMIQDRAIVATQRQYELVCDLSNGVISNYLEWLSKIFNDIWSTMRPLYDSWTSLSLNIQLSFHYCVYFIMPRYYRTDGFIFNGSQYYRSTLLKQWAPKTSVSRCWLTAATSQWYLYVSFPRDLDPQTPRHAVQRPVPQDVEWFRPHSSQAQNCPAATSHRLMLLDVHQHPASMQFDSQQSIDFFRRECTFYC